MISFFLIACSFLSWSQKNKKQSVHAFRLKPGQDLRLEIEDYVKKNNIEAGWIMTCVGSLSKYALRFANKDGTSSASGHFEIVSVTGTVSKNGSHIHISISDENGKTIGGHLVAGATIYTTAEIVLQSSADFIFERAKDGSTIWEELQIKFL